jgi:2-polyprenyl-3-methyl-5-hydroxy-6-metoxy-1,4-benzoquinol methylase
VAAPKAKMSPRGPEDKLFADPRRPEVSYAPYTEAVDLYYEELNRIAAPGGLRVCDIGGGAKPLLSLKRIGRQELDYVLLDIDPEELALAPEAYEKLQGDILAPGTVERLLAQGGPFDLVTSRWAAEHMSDGAAFHRNVFSLLRPGGAAVHLFPTLFALPFTVNRLLPDRLSKGMLFGVTDRVSKFPAHYSWCRGPTDAQLARLRGIGYEVERYVGFFGHGFFAPLAPLDAPYRRATGWLLRHPRPALTSFALAVLRRPAN